MKGYLLLLGSGTWLDSRLAVRACTNRPRLCPGDEVDACGLRLDTRPLFPCEGNHISCPGGLPECEV